MLKPVAGVINMVLLSSGLFVALALEALAVLASAETLGDQANAIDGFGHCGNADASRH